MTFKDILRKAFEEIGGVTSDNLLSIAALARDFADDITAAYIRRLLGGQPPRDRDRLALEHAFGINLDEDQKRRNLTKFALDKNLTKWSAERFVEFASLDSRFRDEDLSEYDMEILFDQFNNRSALEIEEEIFELDRDSD